MWPAAGRRAAAAAAAAAPLAAGLRRALSAAAAAPDALRFCVVGSGPAGFYTVDRVRRTRVARRPRPPPPRLSHRRPPAQILKRFGDAATVDLLEALPTPFGLVRFGVAPDHPDTKNVAHHFQSLLDHPRVAFFGNVRLGAPLLALADLRARYHGVVLACGAEGDRRAGRGGAGLAGAAPARRFVNWYNGYPDAPPPPADLANVESVAILGLGNVALDCARVLLKEPDALAETDAAACALGALRGSAVRAVHLVARRGPAQAACTPKELRELLALPGVAVRVHPEGALEALSLACAAELAASRVRRRVVEVLRKAVESSAAGAEASPPAAEGGKELHIHFFRAPVETVPDARGGIAAVRLERTALTTNGGVAATGELEDLPAQLVLESVGYRALPLEGAPFDAARAVVPNVLGQVVAPAPCSGLDGDAVPPPTPVPGLFVCGWLKRGPTGIIGTNLLDAEQTVNTMVRAREGFPEPQEGLEGLAALLAARGARVVDAAAWARVDAAERAAGCVARKPREKLATLEELLAAAEV
jgi:adrenodoxin-NADP+ reductase